MSLLTLDIGNSRIGVALVDGNSMEDRFDGRPASADRDQEARVAEAFDWCLDQSALHDDLEGVVLSSVVPTQAHLVRAMFAGHPRLGRLPFHQVGPTSPLPMPVSIAEVATVGADRFCNVAGAVTLEHRNAIVVDLGTANTYDLLEDGVFVGGLIGPGAITAHRAMVNSGAQLPPITFSWPITLVGRTTAEAMVSGSFYQAVGSVTHVIQRLRERCPEAAVLVTGGLGEMLAPELGDRVLYVPGLTHLGAAAIGRGV